MSGAGSSVSRGERHRLLYLVSEDWYFVSHRLPLAVAARDAGYDVMVATRVARHGDIIRDAGLDLIPISLARSGLEPTGEIRTLAELVRIYKSRKPDLVHHVAVKPVVYGSLAARLAGVRHVVNALMGLGFVFTSRSAKAQVLRPVVRQALRASLRRPGTFVIVQNKDDFGLFCREGLARAEALRLVPGSGVDPARYASGPPPAGEPLVILPARLLRDKGVVEFVEAARQLKAEGIGARFALVGEPDLLNPASLRPAEVARWIEDGTVEGWGWRQDMAAVLAQASIVCLPSYREGFPKALLEAAAAGRAIVTTDVPGCRELIRAGENGWLVPARDSQALAAGLREAITRPDLRAGYAAAARRRVAEEFSLEAVIRQTLAVYEEALASRVPAL